MDKDTSFVTVCCPITAYYFPNLSEEQFYEFDLDDDDIDQLDNAKLETLISDKWLTLMKTILPHAQRHLMGAEPEGEPYREIAERIANCVLSVENRDNRAWLALTYELLGPDDPNLTYLMEYATEQLLILDFEIRLSL